MRYTRSLGRACKPLCIALVVLPGLLACALKPVPEEELRQQALKHAAIPEQWRAPEAATAPLADSWLSSFADPQLEALVNEALIYNRDLRAAAARVEQAAGYLKTAGAQLSPTVSVIGKTGSKSGADGGLDLGVLKAAWELDVWGRIRAGRSAAQYQYMSSAYDFSYARQSLAALVVKSWYTATEAWLQRGLGEETVDAARELLRLARERQRIGAGDARDVAIAQANLHLAQDSVFQLEQSYTQALRALELLLGRYPAAEIEVPHQMPAALPPVPAGLPAALLERRPDVIAAERRVAAAFNLVEEARAARLPSISLTASASWVSSDLLVLKDRDDPRGSFGASLLAPLFRGGELQAQVEIRTAEQQEAVAQYGDVALAAFGDVENALTGEFILARREPLLAAAVQDNEQALVLSETQYRVGKIDLRAVKVQQVELYQARMQRLRLQNERIAQRVNLYLALGGSFDN
ncbi:MAG: efflux transporter outer membrane subunit [Thiogranum sp.]|nr:efflux transporter outer membrane subunit [Thiogranum sp.]